MSILSNVMTDKQTFLLIEYNRNSLIKKNAYFLKRDDGQTDKQTDRQTDRRTDRQTDRDRQTDKLFWSIAYEI